MKRLFKFKQKPKIEPKYFKIGDHYVSQQEWEEIAKPATTGTLSVENIREMFKNS